MQNLAIKILLIVAIITVGKKFYVNLNIQQLGIN